MVMERGTRISCSVGELVARVANDDLRIVGDADVVVSGVCLDSRDVIPGDLFCCVRGTESDGHEFAHDAVTHGASALVVDHDIAGIDASITKILTKDVRAVMGPLAAAFHGWPSTKMCIVGVTGTNGKTTTTAMLAAIFETTGNRTKVLGTLTGSRTTPEATVLQSLLADSLVDGVTHVAMEVSSHALDQLRVDGTTFAAVVFTNLGRDHLDYHETTERYFAAKASLFIRDFSPIAVINSDDVHGRLLIDARDGKTAPYSRNDVTEVQVTTDSVSFRWEGTNIDVPIGGDFNVDNAIAACVTAKELGFSIQQIKSGLASLRPVKGRFEVVPNTLGLHVIVDYAHTPEALQRLLTAVTADEGARLVLVFGCGGDRDAGKRPVMGAIAAQHADVVVLTSDNPRHEDPELIINQIKTGIEKDSMEHVMSITDRRAAITTAIGLAQPGDVVVVAGRGHETQQDIAGEMHDFDDMAVATDALREREARA